MAQVPSGTIFYSYVGSSGRLESQSGVGGMPVCQLASTRHFEQMVNVV